jgi:hypothetical protein
MGNDTFGPGAERPVSHLLVRRNPAARVPLPAELRKRSVEAGGERWQHFLEIEVPDSPTSRF